MSLDYCRDHICIFFIILNGFALVISISCVFPVYHLKELFHVLISNYHSITMSVFN